MPFLNQIKLPRPLLKAALAAVTFAFADAACAQDGSAASSTSQPPNITKLKSEAFQCSGNQILLFYCRLDSGQLLSLCLNNINAPYLWIKTVNNNNKKISLPLNNPKQTIGINAHGYSTIITGYTQNIKFSLFIDTNYNDPAMAALSSEHKSKIKTNFCKNSEFQVPTSRLKNRINSVNVFSLMSIGVTKPLEVTPEWPSN